MTTRDTHYTDIPFRLLGLDFIARTDGRERVMDWPKEDAGESCRAYYVLEVLPGGKRHRRWPILLIRSGKGWITTMNKFVGYWSSPAAALRMHKGTDGPINLLS